jgi:PAS domain S-box-containing protein
MQMSPLVLGMLLLVTGAVFFALVWGALRLLPRLRSGMTPSPLPPQPGVGSLENAVIIVQTGGRVEYVNPAARTFFDLREGEQPGLELLASRIRPSEEFLKLCAVEGQARFSINGRPVECSSYQLPGQTPSLLVAMNRPDIPLAATTGESSSNSALKILTDFNHSISGKTTLAETVQSVLENVEQLIPVDSLEVRLWDADQNALVAHRFVSAGHTERRIERTLIQEPTGYAGALLAGRKPIYLQDAQAAQDEMLKGVAEQTGIRSFIGLPLMVQNEMVGTLEAALTGAEAYSQVDFEVLKLVASPVAVALYNATLIEKEQQRAVELRGLADLAQIFGLARDSGDLFTRLVQNLAPLFDVKTLGFLLYNENRRALEAQVPFTGMPPQVVAMYHVPLPVNSLAEERFLKQETILSTNAMEDEVWREMGFQDYARAASWRDTALVPLVSSGHPLGYLQVANHNKPESAFSAEELRLLKIVANQTAPIIDNVMLVQQARQRTQRSETLRRIVSLAASSATTDEVLRFTAQELARLLQADMAAIFLADAARGVLRLHAGSLFGISAEAAEPLRRLFVDETQYHFSVTGSRHAFTSGHLSEDQRLLAIYRPLVESLEMESVIVVPLIVRDQSLGELMIASKVTDLFSAYDLQVVTTAASQLASSIEGMNLSNQTDEGLRRRVDQLTAMTHISRELNTTMEWKYLLQVVYDEALRTTRADCGTILLFDLENKETSGTDPQVVFHLGDKPTPDLLPIEQEALRSGDPVLVAEIAEGEALQSHDGVRSALVVPIAYQQSTVGLIHLHSYTPGTFDQTALDIIKTLAVQAAIALGNAQRFQEQVRRNELLNRRAETLSKLFETANALDVDKPLEQSLEALAYGIQEATPFQVVLISVVEPENMVQRRVTGVGMPLETLNMLKSHRQPWSAVQQLLRPEFKNGQGYFIPYDKRPLLSSEVQIVKVIQDEPAEKPNAWNPEDALFFPLGDSDGNPIGLISLDAPRDGLRPDRTTLETVEIFAAQAALIIHSSRQLVSYRNKVETLSASLDRQQQLNSISQNHLPTLLHKDLEQMIAIRGLEQRALRIRAGLEITEAVNRQVDAQSALLALGRELLTRLEMNASLVAENTQEGPRLVQALGNIPRGISPEALFGQRNPLRACLQSGETMLVMNLDQDDTWRDAPLLNSLHAKSFICLPILLDEKPVAGILAVSSEPLPTLTEEDRQVYFQISRQVSIILQNLSLLTETRRRLREVNLLLDFSRQLSGLDADSILNALVESALRVVTAAHAGVVLIQDAATELLIPRAALGYADVSSLMQISYKPGDSLPGQVFLSRKSRRVDEVSFARDYNLSAEHLLRYREATSGRLPVSSLLLPIQTGEGQLGVMVLDNFNTPAAFSADDEALLLSLTQQVALSLENVRLIQVSQERAVQLQALTNVSATMTSSLESGELVSGLLDSLHAVLPYDTGILWLRQGNAMSVAAARGFPDNEQRLGLTVAIEDSRLLAEMSHTSQGIVVTDIREDPRFPALVEAERLSWMGVPLVSKNEVVGVIALDKTEPGYFSLELTQMVTTFASQAAIALENARLYEVSLHRAAELDERSQRMALLNRISSELSGSLSEEQVLRLTAIELHQALAAQKVSMITFDRAGSAVIRVIIPGNEKTQPRFLPRAPIFDRLRESLGVFSSEHASSEPDLASLLEHFPGSNAVLLLPLVTGQSLHALAYMNLAEGHRSSPAEIELALTISNQAAVAFESARLYQATVSRAEQLATINRASYEIGLSLDPEEIYTSIHRAAGQLMIVESFVISLLDEEHNEIEGVYLMDPSGRAPSQRLSRNEGISGRVINSGEALLIQDAAAVESGGKTYGEGNPRSILAVPVAIGGKVIGMLSAQSYHPNTYTEDEQQTLGILANQAAVALQNGRLFAETRRLAEVLEQRVVERTAELAREQRNTETLLRIITEASSTLDLDRALNRTLALLNDAIGAEQGSILLVDEKDNTIHYRAGYGYLTPVMTEGSRPTPLKIGEGLAGWVIKNRQSVCVEDLHTDERWKPTSENESSHRSVVGSPLMVGEEAIGAIMVFHRKSGYFTQEHVNLVQAIGSQVSVAINNAKLYELIRDQAERLGGMLRNEQVEASRQQAILEAVADGVLVTDADNRITFINSSAERIMMLDADSILGQALENFVGLFGAASRTWMQTIRSWSENPSSHQAGDTYAEQLNLENGHVVLVHLAPVIWKKEFLGTVSIFRDITHEVEVDRLKSEFVATVSHELRTPMTSIKGYVDVLLMGAAGALNENQNHFLDIVRTNTERLSVLVNDLLDISRIEAGRVSLSLQPIDLREVADDVVADVKRRSQEENKPMTLTVKSARDLPRVTGDLERVRQILGNVVDNAYNYTPSNGKIHVLLSHKDDKVQVDVQDNGIGINPADAERVFDRFYRGEDPLVLATPGTGLGLSIVKQLVVMHGGRIWMESTGMPGRGCKFSFTLPVHSVELEEKT